MIFIGTIISIFAIAKIFAFLFGLIGKDIAKPLLDELSDKLLSMYEEAAKTDTGSWTTALRMIIAKALNMFITMILDGFVSLIGMLIIPKICIVHSIILSLYIKLHEKFSDNMKAFIGLGICNIINSIMLEIIFAGTGITYLLMVFVAIFILSVSRYTLIKIRK